MWKYLPLVTQIGAALSCGYIISYILKWLVGPKKIPNPAVEQSDKKTDWKTSKQNLKNLIESLKKLRNLVKSAKRSDFLDFFLNIR
jgi:hypothetical protein